jgi:hypothetical protein
MIGGRKVCVATATFDLCEHSFLDFDAKLIWAKAKKHTKNASGAN